MLHQAPLALRAPAFSRRLYCCANAWFGAHWALSKRVQGATLLMKNQLEIHHPDYSGSMGYTNAHCKKSAFKKIDIFKLFICVFSPQNRRKELKEISFCIPPPDILKISLTRHVVGWPKNSFGFLITCYGKTQMNFWANPLFFLRVTCDFQMNIIISQIFLLNTSHKVGKMSIRYMEKNMTSSYASRTFLD